MESVVGCFGMKYVLDCSMGCVPHPFSDWESLEGKVLWELEEEIAQIEDGAKPRPYREITIGSAISMWFRKSGVTSYIYAQKNEGCQR